MPIRKLENMTEGDGEDFPTAPASKPIRLPIKSVITGAALVALIVLLALSY